MSDDLDHHSVSDGEPSDNLSEVLARYGLRPTRAFVTDTKPRSATARRKADERASRLAKGWRQLNLYVADDAAIRALVKRVAAASPDGRQREAIDRMLQRDWDRDLVLQLGALPENHVKLPVDAVVHLLSVFSAGDDCLSAIFELLKDDDLVRELAARRRRPAAEAHNSF